MGDYTYGMLTVTDCPPEHVEAVIGVIEEYGLSPDWKITEFGAGLDELVLAGIYTVDEVRVGFADEAAAILGALDGVGFHVSEDPKYEWDGAATWRLADGRSFCAETNASGDAILTASQFAQFCDGEPPPTSPEGKALVFERIAAHLGLEVQQAFNVRFVMVEALPLAERILRFVH